MTRMTVARITVTIPEQLTRDVRQAVQDGKAESVSALSGLTLEVGALIAVERGDRRLRVLLDETERAGWPIVVPVGPLAQV